MFGQGLSNNPNVQAMAIILQKRNQNENSQISPPSLSISNNSYTHPTSSMPPPPYGPPPPVTSMNTFPANHYFTPHAFNPYLHANSYYPNYANHQTFNQPQVASNHVYPVTNNFPNKSPTSYSNTNFTKNPHKRNSNEHKPKQSPSLSALPPSMVQGDTNLYCESCERDFPNPTAMTAHVQSHTKCTFPDCNFTA